jgi:bifunctional non-homologous end joining protein LigD
VGYTEGKGERAGFFGSLILAQPGPDGYLKYMGKVGSGFNKAEVRKIYGILKASETDSPLVDARNGAKKLIDHTPVKVSLEIEIRFQETTKRGIFRIPTVRKDDHGQNRIFYDSKTMAAKPRPTNLMDMLKELAEK